LIAALLAACRGAERGPGYEDLLISGRLRSSLDQPPAPALVSCGDETYFARSLAAGEKVWAELDAGQGSQLVVAGCAATGRGRPLRGSLRLELVFGGERVERRLPLAPPHRWWRQEIDLTPYAGRGGSLRLEAEGVGPRASLYLRDVYLRRQRPLPRRPSPPPLQVLLISVDTLRHDALSALGGPWPTPALDRLVAEGETFEHSYATASWTKPSHGSLFTGQHPPVHRAMTHTQGLHPALPTLAEYFQRAGFATAGLAQDIVHLDARFGFDRGFDEYRTVHWTLPQMARYAADWIADHRSVPFFYFLHTFAAHSDFYRLPYEAPDVDQATVEERFGVPHYGCERSSCASERLARINQGELQPLPGEAEILRFLYGEGVRFVDAELGRLFDDLRAQGVFDDLLIVFTSDHGEVFLEHGKVGHGHRYEPVLRVPLVIKWPGGAKAGERRIHNVSGVDVAPTLLAAAGIEVRGLPGVDLRRRLRPDRPIFAGTWDKHLIVGRMKLTLRRQNGGPLLYDLSADPGEEHDLSAERPAELARLGEILRRKLRQEQQQRRALDRLQSALTSPLSEEERERLRALGYLDD